MGINGLLGSEGSRALERCQSRCRRQQLAQDDYSRHADALLIEVELRDAVRTQRGERDSAEVCHEAVLEHRRRQCVGRLTRDAVEADTASGASVNGH